MRKAIGLILLMGVLVLCSFAGYSFGYRAGARDGIVAGVYVALADAESRGLGEWTDDHDMSGHVATHWHWTVKRLLESP